MSFRSRLGRSRRYRRFILIRLVLLGVLLVATFVFHVSGTTVAELRILRLAIVAALVIGAGWLARRRGGRAAPDRDDDA